jgi:hypothetical protein
MKTVKISFTRPPSALMEKARRLAADAGSGSERDRDVQEVCQQFVRMVDQIEKAIQKPEVRRG